jgi:outer membrane murein-binding lipoprotein Lpp
MRAYVRRACVPAVLMSAVLLTGCSSEPEKDRAAPTLSASAGPVSEDQPSQKPSESASSSAPAPEVGVGEKVKFDVGETDEYGENWKVTTQVEVTVVSAKYVTPAEVDTTNEPENGQSVELTLKLANVGKAPAEIMTYGMMQWQDEKTAAQDATTLEGVGEGQDLDTTYRPGQSVTGKLVLDVVRKGGTVGYYSDNPSGEPSFAVKLPKS